MTRTKGTNIIVGSRYDTRIRLFLSNICTVANILLLLSVSIHLSLKRSMIH